MATTYTYVQLTADARLVKQDHKTGTLFVFKGGHVVDGYAPYKAAAEAIPVAGYVKAYEIPIEGFEDLPNPPFSAVLRIIDEQIQSGEYLLLYRIEEV